MDHVVMPQFQILSWLLLLLASLWLGHDFWWRERWGRAQGLWGYSYVLIIHHLPSMGSPAELPSGYTYRIMENQATFLWENLLYMAIFNSYMLNCQRVGSLTFPWIVQPLSMYMEFFCLFALSWTTGIPMPARRGKLLATLIAGSGRSSSGCFCNPMHIAHQDSALYLV